MTDGQKTQIVNLRREGYGYVKIAKALNISENTMKSFCRRGNVARKANAARREQEALLSLLWGRSGAEQKN